MLIRLLFWKDASAFHSTAYLPENISELALIRGFRIEDPRNVNKVCVCPA